MAKSDIKPKTITRVLDCKLTDPEMQAKGEELVKLLEEADTRDEKRKAASKAAQDDIKGLLSKARALRKQITEKVEYRDVECIEEPAYERKLMVVTRKDTMTVVDTRPLRKDELQTSLLPDGGDPDKVGDKPSPAGSPSGAMMSHLTPIDGGKAPKKPGKAKGAKTGATA